MAVVAEAEAASAAATAAVDRVQTARVAARMVHLTDGGGEGGGDGRSDSESGGC